jgi:hypothetical protein
MEDKNLSEKFDKKEPITITLPHKWNEEVYFMNENIIHQGKIIGFSCNGQFGDVYITSYDIIESYDGEVGRCIEINSEFIFSSREELIKKLLG